TFFDVGQGDAALVESPGGARVLVDGGPDPEALSSTLRRRRPRSLDLVAFSHPHADHVMGLASVLARFPVSAAIDPGVPSVFTDGMARRAPEDASAGDRFRVADLTIDVLGPDSDLRASAISYLGAPAGGGEGSSVNDASLVLRFGWGSDCALFPGDLEEEGQRRLLERWRRAVACTILKAPHHGSAHLLPEFVTAVDPELVTVSVGRRNEYGHPTRRALSIFERAGARVLRTDHLGDIVLEMDERGRVAVREGGRP
ncbi:MAG: ComEC/Rec2 family competence protein, partial [Actinomycetota bacterium]